MTKCGPEDKTGCQGVGETSVSGGVQTCNWKKLVDQLLGRDRLGALGLIPKHVNPMPLPFSPSHVGWQLLPTDAPLPVGLSAQALGVG